MSNLLNAVIEQSGGIEAWEEMKIDISSHGIDGGFSGWIYYTETNEFYDNNERDIKSLLSEQADEYGQGVSELLASFNCLDISTGEADNFLMGLDEEEDNTQIKNALAWFTVEHYAHYS